MDAFIKNPGGKELSRIIHEKYKAVKENCSPINFVCGALNKYNNSKAFDN
jgi:hypothetical protein